MLSHVQFSAILWIVAHQAPLSTRFSQQEYWNWLPFPPPGDLPIPGIQSMPPASPVLQADSLLLSPWRRPPWATPTQLITWHIEINVDFMSRYSLSSSWCPWTMNSSMDHIPRKGPVLGPLADWTKVEGLVPALRWEQGFRDLCLRACTPGVDQKRNTSLHS